MMNISTTLSNNNDSNKIENARLLQGLIETDWSDGGKSYDWYIGMMLGTDEYLNTNEKKTLTEKCNEIIFQHLLGMDEKRLKHMLNKARSKNETFMETFGKNAFGKRRVYQYDDNIVNGNMNSVNENVK